MIVEFSTSKILLICYHLVNLLYKFVSFKDEKRLLILDTYNTHTKNWKHSVIITLFLSVYDTNFFVVFNYFCLWSQQLLSNPRSSKIKIVSLVKRPCLTLNGQKKSMRLFSKKRKGCFVALRSLELDIQPTFCWFSSTNEQESIIDWWMLVLNPASAAVRLGLPAVSSVRALFVN